jgi:CRISPR-associated endonuclease/helicase Cas3
MASLWSDQFADFFRAVHGHAPFDWQRRFAEEVLSEGFHDVVHVPTACGKTSILDITVFHLAMDADRNPADRIAARRLCFVIDRRLVVDEVTDHAIKILKAVQSATCGERSEPALKAVAERLAFLAANPKEPLRVVRLRGGIYRDDGWAADPLTPTIIVSTVDQIGSRLLFRGYGVSRRSRPLQAGLLAFDTRIILDEAHLSNVFAETVSAVRRFQGWAKQSPLPPSRLLGVTRMSATTMDSGRSFALCIPERHDHRLAPRLEARKRAELIEVQVEPITKQMRQKQARRARELEHKNRTALIKELVHHARKMTKPENDSSDDARPRVIGVIVNRVATARAVFERLSDNKEDASRCDAILLTGRIRSFDRDRLIEKWLPKIKAGRDAEPEKPLFVVATQTIEVGANLDFDALVTEAAPLDALRQRFGRLDRLGQRQKRQTPSPACILIPSDQAKESDDDPIYGSAIAETWKWLTSPNVVISTGTGRAKRRVVDFGVNALDAKLPTSADAIRPMLAQPSETPLLFPAHLDAWVQTDPVPEPEPDVAPFLHGRADTPADVQVVWRADLAEGNENYWSDIVALMPPRTREALPVPVRAVRAWLNKGAAQAEVADIEGGAEEGLALNDGRKVLRWRGAENARPVNPNGIRPGDTIIVPAAYGGADAYGWNPGSETPVDDVADPCLAEVIASYPAEAFRRPKLRLRIHPELLPDADKATRERWQVLLDSAVDAVGSDTDEFWSLVQRLLRGMRDHLSVSSRAVVIDAFLRAAERPEVDLYADRTGLVLGGAFPPFRPRARCLCRKGTGLVLGGAFPPSFGSGSSMSEGETEYEGPEDDEASFSPGGRMVPLDMHGPSVGRTAQDFALKCGLSTELTKVLGQAGCWHDEGKRDPRFQAWLHGSELKALAAIAKGEFLAKSGRDYNQWQSAAAFGYPNRSRHEFVSVRLFEQFGTPSDENSDLIRFLIGTHHGRGRPFPPVLDDPEPVVITLTHGGKTLTTSSDHRLYQLDSGWIDLFWRMVRRYGWWGIAYLEAVMITADRTVSAREQRVPQVTPLQTRPAAAEA